MPTLRHDLLVTDEVYHIFNRSVANEVIFSTQKQFTRAVDLLDFYRFPQKLRFSFYARLPKNQKEEYHRWYIKQSPMVTVYAYCFMPNHFHILAKQVSDRGIFKFLTNFQNSYAKYYNTIKSRHGSLFQKPFKAKRVATDEDLLHISRYIHLNPVTSFLIETKDLDNYQWSSYKSYLIKLNSDLVDTHLIINLAGSIKKYQTFVENQINYQRKLNQIKHLIIE